MSRKSSIITALALLLFTVLCNFGLYVMSGNYMSSITNGILLGSALVHLIIMKPREEKG